MHRRLAGIPPVLLALALAPVILAPRAAAGAALPPAEELAGLAARAIGPAGMSGRVTDVEGVPGDPGPLWVGTAAGGVFRSRNGGLTFEPVFDDQRFASIGDIAVFARVPEIVWVGTGEANVRNSVSYGGGVYRSTDGGETWAFLGLGESERIARIVLHPDDPDVAWVAALGPLWTGGGQRGVYKTTDGGRSWRRVLFVDDDTGAADLAIDPSNPNRLLAATWDHRRTPAFFRSGGPGSGLWRSVDGGETWTRLGPADGLPDGELGRIGLAFAPSDPRIVYALVEAQRNVALRSEDGGRTFRRTAATRRFGNRPFYFSQLRVDPERPLRVYSLWTLVSVSEDGGESWRVLVPFRDVHPDHHAMWIDPADGRRIVVGNDGGVAISLDRGTTWRFVETLALAQFYHVAVDDDLPYHVYGGLQDNGSWRGPAYVWENGGIRNHHWDEVGFGDGFDTLPDPRDSRRGYATSQQGFLMRWNLETGERRSIRPAPPEGVELRVNWNPAVALDPFDPDTIWFGSQFVHRSRDRGETWEILSEDLTTNDPQYQRQDDSGGLTRDVTGAENFTTLTEIAPSPVARGVVWVGSDDGRVHLTRDGGTRWTSVEDRFRGVPRGAWVADIHASAHEPGRAFVVLDDHRRGDHRPYVVRTDDFGRRFEALALQGVEGHALVIAEHPTDERVLFLGTEHGLWISLDRGRRWSRFESGVPRAPVRDLAIQRREHDLVIATHGRGLFVLDDIRPLARLADGEPAARLTLFDVPPAIEHVVRQTGASRFPGHGEFRGTNRPYGARIRFRIVDPELPTAEELARRAALRRQKDGGRDREETDQARAVVTVADADGTVVRRFERPVHRGINLVTWDLRRDPWKRPRRPDALEFDRGAGAPVPWGRYRVTVRVGEDEAATTVEVLPDPRLETTPEQRAAWWEAVARAGALSERLAAAVSAIDELRADAAALRRKAGARWPRRLRSDPPAPERKEIEDAARALDKRLDEVERLVWTPPDAQGIFAPHHAWGRLSRALMMLRSSWGPPTAAQLAYLARAERATGEALEALAAVDDDAAALRELAARHGLALLDAALADSARSD
ncbi:MAG: hypothetical protein Kow0062_16640 [Acidobacteriota bacterium]